MKKIFVVVLAFVALFASCEKEFNAVDNVSSSEKVTLTFNAVITKTSLNDDRSVSFTPNEKITVFANEHNYTFTTVSGGTNAVFTGEVDAADATASTFYALCPYNESATISGGVIQNVSIPKSSATVTNGKYSSAKAVAVAITSGSSLQFKQVCALLKFTVPAEVTDLKEVVVFNRASAIEGSLSGTFNVAPNAGSSPTVTVTAAEGNPHQTGAAYSGGAAFSAGTYYIPVLPATLTQGFDIKNTFSVNVVTRVIQNAKMTLVSGQVYDLGIIRKANRFMCNTFENNPLDGEYTGNNKGGVSVLSIVENPVKSSINNSNYVMIDDMTGWADATSGYWQTASVFSTKFVSSCRSAFTKVRMKMYWGSDEYYPRFLFNKGGTAIRPARVNDVEITDKASFDAACALTPGDWKVLEWDATQFESKTNFSDLSSFQIRMFVDWNNTTLKYDGSAYHHVAYIDDIEFL